VEKTAKALEGKGHKVKVVANEAEALSHIATLLKDGVSVSAGGSTTLTQIGFSEFLRAQGDRIDNIKGKAAAAAEKGNMPEHYALLAKGLTADLFFSSVTAVAESGEILGVDLTGTRVGGWITSKQLVLVVSTNKIVADLAETEKRLEYQLKLESARVRVAYKVPASAAQNRLVIAGGNPFNPGRIHVILIEKTLGF